MLGNAAQHRQRVALVVGVLETADYGGGSSHSLGEVTLAQGGLCPEPVKQRRDLGVEQVHLVDGPPLGIVPDMTVVGMFERC